MDILEERQSETGWDYPQANAGTGAGTVLCFFLMVHG